MSAFDYSKFDKIVDSDEEEEAAAEAAASHAQEGSQVLHSRPIGPALPPGPVPPVPTPPPGSTESVDPEFAQKMAMAGCRSAGKLTEKGTEKGRYKFMHQGQLIYEWEQSLEDVNIYVKPPPGVRPDMIACTITASKIELGLEGNPPFINENFAGPVVKDESFWGMNDGEINIYLSKMRKAETWESALAGHASVDPFTKQEIQKQIMLERFQEENPGFDFRDAEFNGQVPDARTFMEGVKYN